MTNNSRLVRALLLTGSVAACLGAMPAGAGPTRPLELVDQQMTQPPNGWQSIILLAPIGQEFTPTFPALDAVEILVEEVSCQTVPQLPGDESRLWINIRQDTIVGLILATSAIVTVPLCASPRILRFTFPAIVRLEPGRRHVIEVSGQFLNPGLFLWSYGAEADQYAGGDAIALGEREPGADIWFREGLERLVPTACAKGLWEILTGPDGRPFRNQGDCLRVARSGR